jgi:hypothetical protein
MKDEDIFKMDARNRVAIAEIRTGQKATWAILLVVLAVILSNIHIGVDPTFILHIP